MASDSKGESDFYLLQPELLNEAALKQILELRCVKLQNINSLTKTQLVEIFYRVAVPLPQRIYKDNRRGKLLMRMRRKQERSNKKAESSDKRSSITYGFSEASTSRAHSTGDRLKPPPDTINFERKKIRLSSVFSVPRSDDLEAIRIKRLKKFDPKEDTNGDVLDRIVIKDRRKEKCEAQKDTVAASTNKVVDSPSSEKILSSKKVKLKRSHGSSNAAESPAAGSKDSEPKKHKTRIMWP